MEYSKEDLMEAKKQIWGVGENMGTEAIDAIWTIISYLSRGKGLSNLQSRSR